MPTSLNFPVLTKVPSQDGYGYIPRPFDLKDTTEFSYQYSRPNATRNVGGWKVAYKDLPDVDFRALWTFWQQVKTSGPFNWIDITEPLVGGLARIHEVRFNAMSTPEYAGFDSSHLWNVSFELYEV